MTLSDYFTLNSAFFAGMSRVLKHGFRSLATVKLLVNVGEHQTETNGIARFPCDSTVFLLQFFIIIIVTRRIIYGRRMTDTDSI